MKSKRLVVAVVAVALLLLTTAATIIRVKISAYPLTTTLGTNDLFLIAIAGDTNKSIRFSALKAAINSTNLTLSVNATNATTPNLQDSATVTWSKSGSNITANSSGGTTVSVNATNVTTPNLQDSATVTWSKSGSNLTATATATGGGGTNFESITVTNSIWHGVTRVTYSGGTNLTLDLSLSDNFFVDLTNTAFFATPSNLPSGTTSNRFIHVYLKQDSTGIRAVTWTNTQFRFMGNVQPTITTNANAIDIITFSLSPFTAGRLYGIQSANFSD